MIQFLIPALASLLGAGIQAFGANKAADKQSAAAQAAIAAQLGMFKVGQQNLQPYMQLAAGNPMAKKGTAAFAGANHILTNRLNALLKPINPINVENTPGYNFVLGQGEKAVTNAAAARGLGTSGYALKGAATFAKGLADSTYAERFGMARSNREDIFNKLMGIAGLGESAAAGNAGNAVTTGANVGSNIIGAGNAQAAGSIAGTNAAAGALGDLGQYAFLNKLLANGSGGPGGGPAGMYGS